MPRGLGQDEAATFRIDDGDLQIDVSQPKEIVWDQKHLSEIARRTPLKNAARGLVGIYWQG